MSNNDDDDDYWWDDDTCQAAMEYIESLGRRGRDPILIKIDHTTGKCDWSTCRKCRKPDPQSNKPTDTASTTLPQPESNSASPASDKSRKRKSTEIEEGPQEPGPPTKKTRGKKRYCEWHDPYCRGNIENCRACQETHQYQAEKREIRARKCQYNWPDRCENFWCTHCGMNQAPYGPTTRNKEFWKQKEKDIANPPPSAPRRRVDLDSIAENASYVLELRETRPPEDPWIRQVNDMETNIHSYGDLVLSKSQTDALKEDGLSGKHYLTVYEEEFMEEIMLEERDKREMFLVAIIKRLETELHSNDFWIKYDDGHKIPSSIEQQI